MWQKLEEINSVLKANILCLPPSRNCIEEKYIDDVYSKLKKKENIIDDVVSIIVSPRLRAYQMEFRYKKTKIFEPYMSVLEYGTFSSVVTDWVSAYLTLLPVIEASLRKWMEYEPSLSLKSLHKFYYTFGKYYREKIGHYNDGRDFLVNEYIKFIKYCFKMLFMGFEEYSKNKFKEFFNRNFALHRLEGAKTLHESASNVVRITLLLDVISELYLMQDPDNWWYNCVLAEAEQNLDFQVRWHLYEKKAMDNAGHDDMLIIQNILGDKASDKKKKAVIMKLKRDILQNFNKEPMY
ncbi:MAG: hypothetical protein FWC26_07400 [Fibromonadales bacterium]|nr:hypothetical protein [Fibromonadales bacterium]